MQHNLNAYDSVEFQQRFPYTELGKRVLSHYDHVLWDHSNVKTIEDKFWTRTRFETRMLSVVPYYYLEYLLKHSPEHIYDIGCGNNIFKKHIPNVIGIDPTYEEADIKDFVDDDYVAGHQNYFESMFAINSIHFFPLKHIREKINRIITMIKPGGRCFMTLNVQRMLERDIDSVYDNIEQFIRKQLYQMDFEYEVFDVNVNTLNETVNEYLDGNVRMVCHRI